MKNDNILIVGAGAIGAFYGALLSKAGATVSVVCRSDYDRVKQHGYTINSNDLGQWLFTPSQVIQSASAYQGVADYIIICTKVIPEIDRIQLIQQAVTANTCIVFIQNGIDIEQELIAAFPNNEIISGLAFICCNRIKPGVIDHLAYGKLTLGYVNQATIPSRKAQHLSQLITQSGIESITSDNISEGRWLKCLWNAAFNPLSVLSDGLSTLEILNSQEALIRIIMQEVSNIAKAYGYILPTDSIDLNIEHTYQMPPYKTSMLLDFENNRPLETEAILGNTVRAAQKKHIACPTLETLYGIMQLKQYQSYGFGATRSYLPK